MSVPKANGPLMINGQPLSLSHLAAITRQVRMDLPGGHQKTVRADFHFSCHCYSRSPKKLGVDQYGVDIMEAIPQGLLVPDGSAHMPRDRIFCPDRYELSKQLVACIDAMIANNGIVTNSNHINYFHFSSLTHNVANLPNPADYYIFFGLKTIKPDNMARQFKISVESAYVRANANGRVSRTLSEALGREWATK